MVISIRIILPRLPRWSRTTYDPLTTGWILYSSRVCFESFYFPHQRQGFHDPGTQPLSRNPGTSYTYPPPCWLPLRLPRRPTWEVPWHDPARPSFRRLHDVFLMSPVYPRRRGIPRVSSFRRTPKPVCCHSKCLFLAPPPRTNNCVRRLVALSSPSARISSLPQALLQAVLSHPPSPLGALDLCNITTSAIRQTVPTRLHLHR